MGISWYLLQWFQSYLSNHKQCVVLNGVVSEWADVLARVIRGSILGLLLFLIYINNIVNNILSSMRLFADDTSIYIIIDNLQTATLVLKNSKWVILILILSMSGSLTGQETLIQQKRLLFLYLTDSSWLPTLHWNWTMLSWMKLPLTYI